MTPFFERILAANSARGHCSYAEPYAGGAGTAVNLLLSGKVERIAINDAAIGIYSFWRALVNEGPRFLELLYQIPIDLEEWRRQRMIFKTSTIPSFELGFATFYLSRTNRSGILFAGPIGGQDPAGQANASYKIDCRFNRKDLISRITKVVELRDQIQVSNLDALAFLKEIEHRHTLVYLDPPYYCQGEALYLNYYRHDDHVKLAQYLKYQAKFDWILSYDNVESILEMYSDFPLYQYNLSYTAQNVKQGSELITHSSGLQIPKHLRIKKRGGFISFLEIA